VVAVFEARRRVATETNPLSGSVNAGGRPPPPGRGCPLAPRPSPERHLRKRGSTCQLGDPRQKEAAGDAHLLGGPAGAGSDRPRHGRCGRSSTPNRPQARVPSQRARTLFDAREHLGPVYAEARAGCSAAVSQLRVSRLMAQAPAARAWRQRGDGVANYATVLRQHTAGCRRRQQRPTRRPHLHAECRILALRGSNLAGFVQAPVAPGRRCPVRTSRIPWLPVLPSCRVRVAVKQPGRYALAGASCSWPTVATDVTAPRS
jgi:hypothetical protein